jgi:hypothetical protein
VEFREREKGKENDRITISHIQGVKVEHIRMCIERY